MKEKIRYRRRSADNREEILVKFDEFPGTDWFPGFCIENGISLALKPSALQEDLGLPASDEAALGAFADFAMRSGHFVFPVEVFRSQAVSFFRVIDTDRNENYRAGRRPPTFAGWLAVSRSHLEAENPTMPWTKRRACLWAGSRVGDRLTGLLNGWLCSWILLRDGEVADGEDGFYEPEEALEKAISKYPHVGWTDSALANNPYVEASGKFIELNHH